MDKLEIYAGSHTIDKTVLLSFPTVPNPNTLFPNVPTDSNGSQLWIFASAFFSCTVDKENRYLFAFTWKNQ